METQKDQQLKQPFYKKKISKPLGCLILILFFLILIVISGSDDDTDNISIDNNKEDVISAVTDGKDKEAQSDPVAVDINDMQVGDDGFLRIPDVSDPKQVICLGATKDEAGQITSALLIKDYIGILELPGAFCVGNGSKIKLLEKDFPYRRVRIIEGINEVDTDKFGLSGWLPLEWVVNK